MNSSRKTCRLPAPALATLVCLCTALLPPNIASAAIYKCVDLDGVANYSRSACSEQDLLDRVIADSGFGDARGVPERAPAASQAPAATLEIERELPEDD